MAVAVNTGAAIVATLALAATAARAETTDLVVHCDPPLAHPLRDIAVAFYSRNGVQLRIFPTAPNAIPAQLAREIQNDVVVTLPEILARIGANRQLADFPRSAQWRNRLVVAARRGAGENPSNRARWPLQIRYGAVVRMSRRPCRGGPAAKATGWRLRYG